ncbi:MAG: urease accessory protein UreE [Sphaerospermopsis kisseleviana]
MTTGTLTLTQRLASGVEVPVAYTLALTAEERQRSRLRIERPNEPVIFLRLPRGTQLQDGDFLRAEDGTTVKVVAQLEPVMTVTASGPLDLLRAAYHLGNRHVPLEIQPSYLRLSPDPVLRQLLAHQAVQIIDEIQPFYPERGGYQHSHTK